jgi:hypothetical protein
VPAGDAAMLTINLEFDANASAAPQSFRNAVQAAADILEAAIYDPITVNIDVGYGEYDGTPLPGGPNGNISLGGIGYDIPVSYSLLVAALAANETSASETEAVDSLPDTVSLNGKTNFWIASAQAKALGVLSPTNTAIDGYVGFPTSFTGNVLIQAAIVEILHGMGLLNSGGVLTLVEYTSPGNHLLTAGTSATPAYFSINGGSTNLANYDVGFDSTLFTDLSNEPLDVPITGVTTLTSLDLTEIGAIGFDVSGPISLPTPGITPTTNSTGAIVVTTQNVSVVENSAIPVLSLIKSVSEPSGDSVTEYVFEDEGSGNGHFSINGIAEPNNELIDVLDTQLNVFDYVGGSVPGSQTLAVRAADPTDNSYSNFSTLTATTVSPPPPALTVAQINTVYADVLGRPASAGEQAAWVGAETSAMLSATQVIADIVNSPEAQDYSWAVVRLYQAAFGRVPDPAGFTVDVDFLDPAAGGGGTLLQLAQAFVASAEFKADYGAPTTTAALTAFTEALYQNVLGRTGSTAEVDAWLATGDNAAQILIGFSNSAEFQAKANPAVASVLTINALTETVVTGSLFQTAITGASSAQTSTPVQNPAISSTGGATEISGDATLELAATSSTTIDFAPGATGSLKLDQATTFTGSVAGFGAGDAIDLADIGFGVGTTLGYAANTDGSGGMVSVSDGRHTASLALFGQYAAAGFATAPDPGGGTLVTYAAAALASSTDDTTQSVIAQQTPS